MTKSILTLIGAAVVAAGSANGQLLLTGIVDGASGSPKGIELYVSTQTDFSGWAIELESNGGSDWSQIFNFDDLADTTLDSGFYYITSTLSDMTSTYSSATSSNTFSDGSFNQNGNDALRILNSNSDVIDQFGDPADVTGGIDSFAWAYQDSYAYRLNGSSANAGTFSESNWSLPGNNFLDAPENSNADVPFGTYNPIPEPSTIAMLIGGVGALFLLRRRLKS